jgi:hypothetical protein
MSLELPFGIKVLDDTPLDSLYGPYVDVAAAKAAVPQAIRYDGLTVMITGTGEYWWLAADLSDTGLVVKSGGAALTDGSGTTANGSAVDLGGTLSSSPTITGDYGINFTNGPASGSGFSIRINPELYTQDGYTGIVASPTLEITSNINFNSAWLLGGTQTFYDVDTATYTTIRIQPTILDDYSGGPNTGNKFYGFYYNPTVPSSVSNYAIVIGSGFSGFGTLTPTARLHIAAGTTTIPPFKLTTGTALTTPEDGTIEYHSSHLYFTIGSTRYQLDQQGGGSGDVTKVGTPTDNQIGVWTGDGTIEGTSGLTYNGSNFQLTGDIGSTGTRITKGWFTDLQVTNAIAGSITGNAATVTTNANLTGHITSTGNAAVLGSFTLAQLNTAVSDANMASLAGSEVLTNKTIDLTDNTIVTTKAELTAAVSDDDILFAGDLGAGLAVESGLLLQKNVIYEPTITANAYTLVATDNKKILHVDNGSTACTITLPNGLVTGFSCSIINKGTGTITLTATTTLEADATTIVEQHTGAFVYHEGSNIWTATGSLGTPVTGGGISLGLVLASSYGYSMV